MKRREFIALVGGAAAWPLAARAQQTAKVYRVSLIFTTAPVSEMIGPDPAHPLIKVFLDGLRTLGHIEGQNLIWEPRSAEGRFERFGEIVAELVGRRVDVIVTIGNQMAKEAKRVTTAVPIVMTTSVDPDRAGIVASLAHPGGNVTGLANNPGPEFEGKRMELLNEVLPDASRVAFLGQTDDWESDEGKAIRAAARTLGVTLVLASHTPIHYADAFTLIARDRPHALIVANSGATFANRKLIADFAVESRMPGIYPYRELVELGGLMSYGADVDDLFRRAAGYVDKILKGAKPADLPVEQPTKFELVINLKTAKTLGIEIPRSLLARADKVLE
jgi:putative tryptophan/tyrosine transport system substrate-binding protein